MSDLRVGTISDAAGTGPVTLTKQSAAKVWAYVNSSSVVLDSFNVSSVTDVASGQDTVNLTNSMATANYSVPSSCNGSLVLCSIEGNAASNYSVGTFNTSATRSDRFHMTSAHGDLA